MNAKEAKRIAMKTQSEKQASFEKSVKCLKVETEKTVRQKIDDEVAYCLRFIKSSAKDGDTYLSTDHPGDDIYPHVKKSLEDMGYRVSQGVTDEGYCIGYVPYMSISW
jgi:acyl-CoA reductase-like NAD-dependent aldehyde dehydrogenase